MMERWGREKVWRIQEEKGLRKEKKSEDEEGGWRE